MAEDQVDFQPGDKVAVLNDGTQVVPENQEELNFLQNVADSNHSPEMQDRIVKMGMNFNPNTFDVNFTDKKRSNLPTELDDQIRKTIREV